MNNHKPIHLLILLSLVCLILAQNNTANVTYAVPPPIATNVVLSITSANTATTNVGSKRIEGM